MKKIFLMFSLASGLLVTACGNHEKQESTHEEVVVKEMNDADSSTVDIDKVNSEIEESAKKVDEALNDL